MYRKVSIVSKEALIHLNEMQALDGKLELELEYFTEKKWKNDFEKYSNNICLLSLS